MQKTETTAITERPWSALGGHGLKLTKQAIDKALVNPYYCGILVSFFIKWRDNRNYT